MSEYFTSSSTWDMRTFDQDTRAGATQQEKKSSPTWTTPAVKQPQKGPNGKKKKNHWRPADETFPVFSS